MVEAIELIDSKGRKDNAFIAMLPQRYSCRELLKVGPFALA